MQSAPPKPIAIAREPLPALTAIELQQKLKDIEAKQRQNETCFAELQELLSSDNARKFMTDQKTLRDYFKKLYATATTMMADSLIAIDKDLIANIDSYEFFYDTSKEPTPGILAAIEFFNKTSEFIAYDIANKATLDEARIAFEYWVRVAGKCLYHPEISDTFVAKIMMSAFSNAAIARLKLTQETLSPEAKKILDDLATLNSSEKNSQNYRHHLTNNPDAIPFIGLYLVEFNSYRETQPYAKIADCKSTAPAYSSLLAIRKRLAQVRKNAFTFAVAQRTREIFTSFNMDNAKKTYDMTLTLEPRAATQEQKDAAKKQLTSLGNNYKDYYPSESDKKSVSDKNSAGDKKHLAKSTSKDAKKVATQAPSKSLANTLKIAAQPRHLILLDEKSAAFSAHLQKFGAAYEHATIKTPALIVDPAQYSQALINASATLDAATKNRINIYAQYKNDEAARIKLFVFGKYGKELDTIDTLPAAIIKKIKNDMSEEKLDKYAKELLKKIELNVLAGQSLQEYNQSKPLQAIEANNVLVLSEYAEDIFLNNRKHLLHDRDLMDEEPFKKILAAVYMLSMHPEYFQNDKANTVILNNRIQLVNLFLDALSKEEFLEILGILDSIDKTQQFLPAEVRDHVHELSDMYRQSAIYDYKVLRKDQNSLLTDAEIKAINKLKELYRAEPKKNAHLVAIIVELTKYAKKQPSTEHGVAKAKRAQELLSQLAKCQNQAEIVSFLNRKLEPGSDIHQHAHFFHLPQVHLPTEFSFKGVSQVASSKEAKLAGFARKLMAAIDGTEKKIAKDIPAQEDKGKARMVPVDLAPAANETKPMPAGSSKTGADKGGVAEAAQAFNSALHTGINTVLDQVVELLRLIQNRLAELESLNAEIHKVAPYAPHQNLFESQRRTSLPVVDATKPEPTAPSLIDKSKH